MLLFATKKQQEFYCAFSTHIMLTIYIITNLHMLYYFDINTCSVTTVSDVSDTLTRRATLRLQLVYWYSSNSEHLDLRYIILKQSQKTLIWGIKIYPNVVNPKWIVKFKFLVHNFLCALRVSNASTLSLGIQRIRTWPNRITHKKCAIICQISCVQIKDMVNNDFIP